MTGCRSIFVFLLLSLSFCASGDESLNGATLYAQNCASCHARGTPAGNRIAPPIVAVKDHYLRTYADKEAFVKALVRWVQDPAVERSLMPGAISRFGLMPALPYSSDTVVAIAAYLYEEQMEKPGWYEEHFNKEHVGKKR